MDFLDSDVSSRTFYIVLGVSIAIIAALIVWIIRLKTENAKCHAAVQMFGTALDQVKRAPAKVAEKVEDVIRLHYTNWCGFCKKMKPVWEQVKNELGGKVNMVEIDEEVAKTPGIQGYPTIIKNRAGKAAEKYSGEIDAQKLKQFILS
jgi:thioredoxin 1